MRRSSTLLVTVRIVSVALQLPAGVSNLEPLQALQPVTPQIPAAHWVFHKTIRMGWDQD